MSSGEFSRIMNERGFVHQFTNEKSFDQRVAYVGFDCTADSLHIGNLVSIMMLRWFEKTGNHPVVLLGGGTTKIGDPSGKDKSRTLLSDDQIETNKNGIKSVFSKVLDNVTLVDNSEWLSKLSYIDFLRTVGTHFSINKMIAMDSVKTRLDREQPMSFIEFNYMLLQSYDFVELNKMHNVTLQLGGSDQWGNITMGIDLVRRMRQTDVYGITTPLLTTASGQKMGKTASGAVWLSSKKLSITDYWQFWRNIEDADVSRFLKLFTDLDLSEIKRLSTLQGKEINDAKKILATEATSIIHGRDSALLAEKSARDTFELNSSNSLPVINTSKTELIDILVESNIASSKSEARRFIQSNSIKVNDSVINDNIKLLTNSKVSFGKKKHVLINLI